ncbi:MAG: hypothetical protein ACI3W5_03520 [Faecousia sp.]
MGWIAKIIWSVVAWSIGSFVLSVFGSQIRIINACTKKLVKRYLSIDYFDIEALNKYLNSVIIKNSCIIAIISVIVFWIFPRIGVNCYLIGMLFTWVISMGAVGMNSNNIEESISIFKRYIKKDFEEDANDILSIMKWQILFSGK